MDGRFGIILGGEEGKVLDNKEVQKLKAETSKFKEAFTPGPWKRKCHGDEDVTMGEWMKWGKEQQRITSEGRNLIRQEGEKVDLLLGDLVLTLDDGMQYLRRILPDQMRRGVASVADIQK